MTADQILAFVAALVATEPDLSGFPLLRNGGADSRYDVSIAPCAKPVSPLEIEGRTLICGTVRVPEDHAAPEDRQMDLKFAVYKSRSLLPAPDAVVHLHGGPGGGIVDAVALTSTFLEKLRAPAAVTVALQQLESDRAAAAAGATIAGLFDEELAAAGRTQPSRDERLAFGSDYLALRGQTPAPGPLLALVAQHFAGDREARLASLIRLMGPADLDGTFARVTTDNGKLEQVLMENFEMMMFACQEDMDINSVAGLRQRNSESGFPKMLTDEFETAITGLYESCKQFPAKPRPGFHDPVVSPVPALVFSGLMDTQTAASWGPDTARHLGNARSVVFPETGHGALAFSDCAQDLGVAFIENPEAVLDVSCVDRLKPVFVLPPVE